MSPVSIIGDQDDDVAGLPQLARFDDLQRAGIANNWTTLQRLIREEGFPEGFLLSRNARAWNVALVRQWLATRPTAPAPLKGAAKAKRAAKREAA